MKVFIASDHAGFELKEKLKPFIVSLEHEALDCGAAVFNADDDYPDFVSECARKVAETPGSFGIIIGGSGQGEAMAANRVKGVRAGVFYGTIANTQTDISGNSFDVISSMRDHNDANMLSLGARFMTDAEAQEAIRVFLETPFSGKERHVRRIGKF